MINIISVCLDCEKSGEDNWTISLKDDKESVEICGHKTCIEKLYDEIRLIKNLEKLSVKKTLEHLGLEVD